MRQLQLLFPPPRAPRGSPPGGKKKKSQAQQLQFLFFPFFFFFFPPLRCANNAEPLRAPTRLFVLFKVCRRPAALSPARTFRIIQKSRAGLRRGGGGGGRGENQRLKISPATAPTMRGAPGVRPGCAFPKSSPRPRSAPPLPSRLCPRAPLPRWPPPPGG